MSKNLYVGNLPFSTTADDLREQGQAFAVGLDRNLLAPQGQPCFLAEHVGLGQVRVLMQGGDRDGDVEGPHAASLPLRAAPRPARATAGTT